MDKKQFLQVDLGDQVHCEKLIYLLDAYMKDKMGNGKPMEQGLSVKILDGLKKYNAYLGFFVLYDGQYAALANCNLNFSTFKASPLINIHDLIVLPEFRGKGIGKFLLESLSNYARGKGYCRINLEVRVDNVQAQALYKKVGFTECSPPMQFWEKIL
ncbi:MAG: GNAT family N-acetyltransferase [Chlorobi bacterium]|nr:GNAT family N-acetyltransferase [Chlorobiota bacterium]